MIIYVCHGQNIGNNVPKSVRSLFDGIAAFRKSESDRLEKVFRYLVDLNKARIVLLQKTDSIVGQPVRPSIVLDSSLMPPGAMGQDALDFLKEFAPANYVPCFQLHDVDRETFKGILQGSNYTAAVVSWLAACRWPADVSKDYSRKDDWGISWLELLFSFILFSNMYPPVKTSGQKADAVFWD